MNAQEIIDYIANSEKKTPVKVYVNTSAPVDFGSAKVFGGSGSFTVFGDWQELGPILEANRDKITDCVVENDRRNSGVPLLDLKNLKARIEPGAIIREKVEIGEGAVIMMGAILNIGAVVGKGTMIDMGTVLGGRRGLLGGLPRILVPFQLRLSADHGAGFRSESLRLGKEPAEQIIARNSNCGDAEEQDYVKALSLHKVANPFHKRSFFHWLETPPVLLWTGCFQLIHSYPEISLDFLIFLCIYIMHSINS